jgi:hypothetical protein
MLACLGLVFMATVAPRWLFRPAVQAGKAVRAGAAATVTPAIEPLHAQHLPSESR